MKQNVLRSARKSIYKKFKDYIIPYISFSFINLLLQILWKTLFLKETVELYYIFHNVKGILLCYSNKDNMPNCSPLWFLVSLFIASVLFFVIIKFAKRFVPYIITLCVVISYLLYLFANYSYPWKFSTTLMAVSFIYVGYILRRLLLVDKFCSLRLAPLLIPLIGALGIIASLINGDVVGMNENTYGNLLLFFTSAILLSFVLISICKIVKCINNTFLLWLGKNTMITIGFNYFLQDLVTEIYYFIPVVKRFKIHWVVMFIMTAIACLGCTYIYYEIKLVKNKRA